jgi:cytochrome c oxidase subunit 3
VPGPNFVWESHPGGAETAAAPAAGGAEHPTAAAPATHAAAAASRDPALQWHTQIFFSLYFTMTGLHALHMIIGIGIMMVITWMAWQGKFDAQYYTPVEMSGLYWHFVDIVWIYLFPLLYLIDRS